MYNVVVHLYKQNRIDVDIVILNELVIKIEIDLRKEKCIVYIYYIQSQSQQLIQ